VIWESPIPGDKTLHDQDGRHLSVFSIVDLLPSFKDIIGIKETNFEPIGYFATTDFIFEARNIRYRP